MALSWRSVALCLYFVAAEMLSGAAARAQAGVAPIQIVADLTEAGRKLYHAEIDLPVKAGPVTLITPEWIPGNHRPTGPVEDITGVVFTANGQRLDWRRDDVNLYEYHLMVPKGVTSVHAHLDCIVTARATTKLAVLEWEKLLLYPAGVPVKEIAVQASVTVPAGWGIGTALTPVATGLPPAVTTGVDESGHAPAAGSMTTKYAATTVEQLQDSPVIAGQYFHEFALAPDDYAEALPGRGGGLRSGCGAAAGVSGGGRATWCARPGAMYALAPLQLCTTFC